MQAYLINNTIVVADVREDACEFYRQEIGAILPEKIEELSPDREIQGGNGETKTIRECINEEMDARNDWLKMGVPCDLHWPFVLAART